MFTFVRKKLKGNFAHYQFNTSVQIVLVSLVGVIAAFLGVTSIAAQGAVLLFYLSPLWVLYLLPKSANYYWMHYIQHQFLENPRQEGVLLEVLLPKEIAKSPRAMELVFEATYLKPSVTTPFQIKWRGHVRPWWSFEVRSQAGKIHFYVWCWKRLRQRLENSIHAQYPGIQLIEVEDYAKDFKFISGQWEVTGNNYMLTKPAEHPIKTYYDFELNKDPKTEHKVDPFVTMLEMMANIKSGELWLQIIVQQARDSKTWKANIEAAVQKMYDDVSPVYAEMHDPEKMIKGNAMLRPMQYEYIKAMQRATTKSVFDVGIRVVYMDTPSGLKGAVLHNMLNMYKMVGSVKGDYFNWLAPDGDAYLTDFDWPWEDFRNMRQTYLKKKILEAYTLRSYFNPPIIDDAIMMNSEQLATIYHFPGEEAASLGIERLESKRGGPPPDLPV